MTKEYQSNVNYAIRNAYQALLFSIQENRASKRAVNDSCNIEIYSNDVFTILYCNSVQVAFYDNESGEFFSTHRENNYFDPDAVKGISWFRDWLTDKGCRITKNWIYKEV